MPRKSSFNPGSIPASWDEPDVQVDALLAAKLSRPTVRAINVPIARIRRNPFQARQTFGGLEELADAIRKQGFISRLRVRHDPADERFYQLVFGERRLRAAEIAGLTEVPCDVAEHTDDDLLEIGLMENIQREELDPIEEALAFQAFIEHRGYTQQRIADRIGKDKSYVSRRLKLLETPDDVQQLVADRPDTVHAALELGRLTTPEERKPLIEGVRRGELGVRDVRERVRVAVATNGSGDADGSSVASVAREISETLPRPALSNAMARLSVERDIRGMRRTLNQWLRDLDTLDDDCRSTILAFMEEHIEQVEILLGRLQRLDTTK